MWYAILRARTHAYIHAHSCIHRCNMAMQLITHNYISRIYENNVIAQKVAFLCYYPQKIMLFFLHKVLNRHNYILKNDHQGEPTTLHLYVKIRYIENLFRLS